MRQSYFVLEEKNKNFYYIWSQNLTNIRKEDNRNWLKGCLTIDIIDLIADLIKGGFKSEETGGFLLLQNIYSKSLSWAENLNFPPKTVNNLFKFSAQDSDLEYLIWQRKNAPVSSDLKPPLANLPETSQFLSSQMTVLSIFFQVLIVIGIFNFASLPYLVPKGRTDLSKHSKKLLISELMFLAIMNNAKIKLTIPSLYMRRTKIFS